jgi:hypothetical protein
MTSHTSSTAWFAIERLFANPEAAYIHAHYAKRGCYAARIDRACSGGRGVALTRGVT